MKTSSKIRRVFSQKLVDRRWKQGAVVCDFCGCVGADLEATGWTLSGFFVSVSPCVVVVESSLFYTSAFILTVSCLLEPWHDSICCQSLVVVRFILVYLGFSVYDHSPKSFPPIIAAIWEKWSLHYNSSFSTLCSRGHSINIKLFLCVAAVVWRNITSILRCELLDCCSLFMLNIHPCSIIPTYCYRVWGHLVNILWAVCPSWSQSLCKNTPFCYLCWRALYSARSFFFFPVVLQVCSVVNPPWKERSLFESQPAQLVSLDPVGTLGRSTSARSRPRAPRIRRGGVFWFFLDQFPLVKAQGCVLGW